MRLHFTASRSGRAVGMGVRLLAVCAIGAAGGAGVKFLLPKKADPTEAVEPKRGEPAATVGPRVVMPAPTRVGGVRVGFFGRLRCR